MKVGESNNQENQEPIKAKTQSKGLLSGRSLAVLIGASAVTTVGGTLLGPVGIVGATAITAGTIAYYWKKDDSSAAEAAKPLKTRIQNKPPTTSTTQKIKEYCYSFFSKFFSRKLAG